MQAKISKANRPKYFICGDVCIKIDNIIFVQKSDNRPYECEDEKACSVMVGISGAPQSPPIFIPCKNETVQAAIFAELTTILAAL